MTLKLTLNLIPVTAESNLRLKLGASWIDVSKQIRSKNNYTCQICSSTGKNRVYYHTHEVWDFDSVTHVQKLAGFECLCKDCHAVRHWGRSQITGHNMRRLLDHALKVNGCTIGEWKLHLLQAKEEWDKRSNHQWTLSWEHWRELL